VRLYLGLALALAAAAIAAGSWLHRRYGAAIRYSGIGRPYPIGWSVLAFLGDGLIFVGLIALALLVALLFA
jgi:hypothetical protein